MIWPLYLISYLITNLPIYSSWMAALLARVVKQIVAGSTFYKVKFNSWARSGSVASSLDRSLHRKDFSCWRAVGKCNAIVHNLDYKHRNLKIDGTDNRQPCRKQCEDPPRGRQEITSCPTEDYLDDCASTCSIVRKIHDCLWSCRCCWNCRHSRISE